MYIEDKEFVVFKFLNGSICVIENCCLYKGGVLVEGIVSGEYVFCLMYDWKIFLEDGIVQELDYGCVKIYEMLIEGEYVYFVY